MMPILRERDDKGIIRLSAKCAFHECTSAPVPMVPNSDRYALVGDPLGDDWRLEPADGARLPPGWSKWLSDYGEEIVLCETCGLSLRSVFSLPPR